MTNRSRSAQMSVNHPAPWALIFRRYDMSLTAEQILASHKANIETLFGLTTKAFEGVEKLVELNVTASRAALSKPPTTRKPCWA